MTSPSPIRQRRSLRAPGRDGIAEGAALRTEPRGDAVVEIVGGPPRTVVAVVVGGHDRRHVELDSCGAGRVTLPAGGGDERVDVVVDGRVLLTGRLPSTGSKDRP